LLLTACLLLIGTNLCWATTNPIGLWHLDETSGSTAADSSGNGYTINLTSSGYTRAPGHLNEAITFNGTTGYGTTTNWNGVLAAHVSRSISLWFKTTSTADCSFVCWGVSGGNNLCQIGIKNTTGTSNPGPRVGFHADLADGDTQYDCDYPVNKTGYPNYCDGNWHHLAVTYNAGLHCIEVYLDGILGLSEDRFPNTTSSQLFLGCAVNGTGFFNGSLDEVAIYDRALSATEVATLSGSSASYPLHMVTVTSPAYCADVSGNTTISIAAPGFTSATAKCWQSGGTYGSDSTVASNITLTGTNGTGSFTFPAASYPHGPLIVRITGTNGTASDTCYLQLYNTGGTSWNEGIPATAPPAAAGLALVYSDDFTTPLSTSYISPSGNGATYASSKVGGGNFGYLNFIDYNNPANPFLQRDTYLRIRASTALDSTGFLSSIHSDGTGFQVKQPSYFECRFIAGDGPGTWPSFWTLTNLSPPGESDEQDIIEGYGGDGNGMPNSGSLNYQVTSHEWGQTGIPPADNISKQIVMSGIGGDAGWAYTPHVYGMLVGPSTTTYYLDNVQVGSKTTSPLSLTDPFYFLIDFACGGNNWPTDLQRYGGISDMYVDYVRVYGPAAPAITMQPANQSVSVGQTATFTVAASGTPTLTYQWSKNGTAISGATSASYTTPPTTSGDNGATFSVYITNPYGNVTSNTATLTVTSSSLPSPWGNQDIGAVGLTGSSSYASGTFTINGSGANIYGTADAFQYAYQQMTGDGTIIARVASQTNPNGEAKAGVMMRNSLSASDAHASMLEEPANPLQFMYRTTSGGSSSYTLGSTHASPYWVKMVRAGNVFTGSTSPDGTTWTQVATQTITMDSTIYVGLAVCSHDITQLCTATFDNVQIIPSLTGLDIGAVGLTGSNSYASGTFTVSGSGANIYGTVDAFRYVYEQMTGDGTIIARVASQTNPNVNAKAGVMMRNSLSASDAHASMLEEAANPLQFIYRATSDGSSTYTFGATHAPPYWVKMVRSGDVFTGSTSPDGITWTTVATQTISMDSTIYVGLAVCSHDTTQLCTATFDNLQITSP